MPLPCNMRKTGCISGSSPPLSSISLRPLCIAAGGAPSGIPSQEDALRCCRIRFGEGGICRGNADYEKGRTEP